MPISFTLPLLEGKPISVRDRVFTVLTTKFPLSLIELLNEIKRQYRASVSFQAVRKAVLELVQAKVLIKEGKKFALSTDWIINLTRYAGMLHRQYFSSPGSKTRTKVDVGPNVTVYTFSRLLDMDFVWNSVIREHLASKPEPPKFITFEAAHFWFVVVTLAQETELLKEMMENGVKLYYLCYGGTPLDEWTVRHYNKIGVRCTSLPRPKGFVQGYNIGVYGDLVCYTTHPKEIADRMDALFKKYKRIEDVDLDELYAIVTMPSTIELTVIKNPVLARNVRESVLKKF